MIKIFRLGFSARETEGKIVFSEPLRESLPGAPTLSMSKCLSLAGTSVWGRSVLQGTGEQVVDPSQLMMLRAEWESPWSHLWASQPAVQTLGSSWQGLLGSRPEGVPTSFQGSPPFPAPSVCSPLRGAAAHTPIPWGKQLLSWAQGLSPWGRGVFRAMSCAGPSEGSGHRSHVQGPHPGECECESVLDPQSLSQAGTPGAWGAPVISVWGECMVCAGSIAGRCVHYCGWDAMAFRRWRRSLHGHRPEGGDGVSRAAPRESGEERHLVWAQTWNRSDDGK